jgi:Fe-S cluster assembly protein SufD
MIIAAAIQPGFTQEAFDAFLASRDEPGWLTDLRFKAWEVFQELPLPGAPLEEWRRTDLRLFRLDRFALPGPPPIAAAIPQPLLTRGIDLGGQTVALDSHLIQSRLDAELAERGVLFGSLESLLPQYEDLLKPRLLARIVDSGQDKFAALHAAASAGGTLLYVPRGIVIEKPLHVFSALSPGAADFGHALIVLEEGAEATVLAETGSSDAAATGLHCGAIEIVVGPHARLRYVNLQNWGAGVWHFAHQKALVDRGAQLQWTIGALGSRLAQVSQHVGLVGRRAEVQVNGVMFTEGKQQLTYNTLQHHQVPECTSDLLYKGALQDKSRLVWRGMIRVDRDAQKTDGYQRNDNLILSDSARADSIPGLEIQADDVKCSHGATVGRVDDEQVFYARSRGLTRKEAIRMIVAGFFQQVFDRITIPSVRDALGEAIRRRVREYE